MPSLVAAYALLWKMVLEALAVVSLAGAILQFVDFTSKLISKGNHYYRSAEGLPEDHAEVELIKKTLDRIDKNLTDSSKLSATSQHSIGILSDPTVLEEEKALRELVHRCKVISNDYHVLLSKLQCHGPRSRWKSFRRAAKEYWSKHDIQQMLQRLSAVREDLIIHILIVMK